MKDNIAPVPTLSVLPIITGQCAASVTTAPTATDNCTGIRTGKTTDPLTYTKQGTYTITWTYNDGNGNTTTQNQTVIVKDNIAPVVNTKPITITLVNGSATITASQIDNGSTDNCGIGTRTISKSNFTCADAGNNTVILTITDVNGNSASASAVVTVVGGAQPASITSVPSSTVYTGGIATNLYIGYGAQSTILQTSVSSSGAPYTYTWSGANAISITSLLSGVSVAAPVFTPTKAGYYTYTVTITNKYGCPTTASINICVTDIRVSSIAIKGAVNDKVYLCHLPPGNPSNRQTLSISVNAVDAHLTNHPGDRLGSCDQYPCGSANLTSNEFLPSQSVKSDITNSDDLKVTVMPNPTTSHFTIKIESKDAAPVNVVVLDVSGKRIETKYKLNSNCTFEIGQYYIDGYYYAEVLQGTKRRVVKLIKGRN